MTTERDQYLETLKQQFPDQDLPDVQIMTMEFENNYVDEWWIMVEPWGDALYQEIGEIWTLVTALEGQDVSYLGDEIDIFDKQVTFWASFETAAFNEKDDGVVNAPRMSKPSFLALLEEHKKGLMSEQVRVISLALENRKATRLLKLPQNRQAVSMQADTKYKLITIANSLQPIMRLRRVEDGIEIVSNREVAIFDVEGKRLA